MKKFLSLVLALMCLCPLFSAAAEEAPLPELNLPISLEGYQQAYTTLLTAIVPGCSVSWISAPMEDGECYMGVIDNSFVSVMVLVKDSQAQEIAVLMQSTLDESSLMTFLSMAGYAGAALLCDEAVTPVDACDAFVNELYAVFSAINAGEQPENIYGLPGGISITVQEDGSYQYYFVLSLSSAQ
ncbi:MAG: hypothetical protein IKK57_03825 [Clostridia bacterium]|nr:hypothetical protein [Clostridia bacterium]